MQKAKEKIKKNCSYSCNYWLNEFQTEHCIIIHNDTHFFSPRKRRCGPLVPSNLYPWLHWYPRSPSLVTPAPLTRLKFPRDTASLIMRLYHDSVTSSLSTCLYGCMIKLLSDWLCWLNHVSPDPSVCSSRLSLNGGFDCLKHHLQATSVNPKPLSLCLTLTSIFKCDAFSDL